MNKQNTPVTVGIKKETVLLLVFVSLLVGFLGGVVFSAYKIKSDLPGGAAQMPPQAQVDPAHIAALEKKVASHPEDADAWIELGNHYFDAQDYEKAAHAYESALKVRPGDADVWTDLGVMYRRKGDPEAALGAFKKAQELDPSHEASLFNAGVVLMHNLNRPLEAKGMWEKLIRLNPDARTPSGQPVKDLLQAMPPS